MNARSGWRRTIELACIVLAVWMSGCGPRVVPADMVLHNGKIATVDAAKPHAEAIAIRGDVIAAVGTNEEIERYIGESTQVIDLAGMLAVPGLIEGHGHFTGLGEAKMNLDLTRAANWDEITAMVAEAVKKTKPGDYILGRGWHQEKWDRKPSPAVEGFPVHDSLSRISPDNPVLLTHASGHATFANSKAMALAGITRRTPNPPGGEILHDSRGNPIGIFRETASGLLRKAYAEVRSKRTPEEVQAEARKVVELAVKECLSKGLTTFHDAGASFETIDLYRKMGDDPRG
ncbi:MAG: Amidohydrolase 3 [Acidobacteria bacterium]|nr:Amidohydrolase 3 [Acidobacteriota bacterium]